MEYPKPVAKRKRKNLSGPVRATRRRSSKIGQESEKGPTNLIPADPPLHGQENNFSSRGIFGLNKKSHAPRNGPSETNGESIHPHRYGGGCQNGTPGEHQNLTCPKDLEIKG